jgi:hypothetical protein
MPVILRHYYMLPLLCADAATAAVDAAAAAATAVLNIVHVHAADIIKHSHRQTLSNHDQVKQSINSICVHLSLLISKLACSILSTHSCIANYSHTTVTLPQYTIGMRISTTVDP